MKRWIWAGIVLTLSLSVMTGCKKKTEFQVRNEGNTQTGQVDPNQLPPGHPPMDGSAGGATPPSGMPGGNAGGAAIPPPPPAPTDGGLDLAKLEKSLPAAWKKVQPASNMRLAQYQLPKKDGDTEDGEIAVFYFGPNAGSIEANLDRWYGQYSDTHDKASSKAVSKGKLPLTFAEIVGTMTNTMTANGGTKKESRLFAAIVETPVGPFFFKAMGPDKTVKAYRESIKNWLSGATLSGVAAHQ